MNSRQISHACINPIIKQLIASLEVESAFYERYMTRNAWRIWADFEIIHDIVGNKTHVLDIGAVPPLLTALLRNYSKADLMVIDPAASLFRKYFENNSIEYIDGDLLDSELDISLRPVELVLFCEVIEHLTGNLVLTIDRITRYVKPGGYLYITTPNLRSITGLLNLIIRGSGLASKPQQTIRQQYERPGDNPDYFGHVREYGSLELICFIQSFGFEVVQWRTARCPLGLVKNKIFTLGSILEVFAPRARLFGKYLFRKNS
jgi:SAM-dependent methyltransferase